MSVLSFPHPHRAETSLAGFLLGRIQVLTACDPNGIAVTDRREDRLLDVHHAFARVEGDERLFRIIVAPADAEVAIRGLPVAALFPSPEDSHS